MHVADAYTATEAQADREHLVYIHLLVHYLWRHLMPA